MSTIRIAPGNLGALLRAQSKQFPEAVRAGARAAAERGRTYLKSQSPVDLHTFWNAWAVLADGWGWDLYNGAPHAGIIEAGARPHPVSEEGVAALREWVARNVEIVEVKRGKNAGKMRRLSSKQRAAAKSDPESDHAKAIDRVANAIAFKIRREGQKPLWLVKKSLPKLGAWLNQAVKQAVEKMLRGEG